MSAPTPLWITEAEVARLIDIGDAIRALESGLAQEAAGTAENMVKTHVEWGGGHTLHAIGAACAGAGFVGTKTWAHTAGGATPLLILYDAHTGALSAVIEAFVLGQLRTGAISGVATDWLADPGADDMALIGTGKQAITQLAAVAAVRHLKRVRVWSPDGARRRDFAARAAKELGLPVEASDGAAAAIKGAAIVTLVTRARASFLSADMLAPGAHVNAVGAITPERIEFTPALLGLCARVAADSVAQVRALSREFMDFYGTDGAAWSRVEKLSAVVARGQRPARGAAFTLFKAMGMGISDLSLGIEILRRAAAKGLGRAIPQPQKAKPRLTAAAAVS
jgi:ornithine cyclodeaminase